MGSAIVGWSSVLPDKVITNHDLEGWLDTSDEWITERTGIRERRVGGTTSGLAVEAGRKAMDTAGVGPEDIDLVILATTTPDQLCPGSAPTVQLDLGLDCAAFDLNAACSGFVYGLVTASGFLASGLDCVLLIGSETLSKITDWDDRNTAVLFADGAGAAVMQSVDGPGQLLGWHLACDGSARHVLYCDTHESFIQMDGKEVFRRAVRVMVECAERSMDQAGVTIDDIALVVPHQANTRIIDAACQRLGIPIERASVTLPWTGNSSSATIPIALVDAIEKGRIDDGDLVLLVGFGAGMSSAGALLRWGT